jgi:2-hydroxychromene-2-carboxylate isomerase
MSALFRFDTNSPYAYLAALRVDDVLGPGVEWQPIAFAFLLRAQGRVPWSIDPATRVPGQAECERRAAERGVPPFRWPEGWPVQSYTLESVRAIQAAKAHGREREMALAAFRRNFVTGEGLTAPGAVRACWVAAGLDGDLYEAAVAGAKAPLTAATERAVAEGVPGVPTVTVGGKHFWGDDRLEEASGVSDEPR